LSRFARPLFPFQFRRFTFFSSTVPSCITSHFFFLFSSRRPFPRALLVQLRPPLGQAAAIPASLSFLLFRPSLFPFVPRLILSPLNNARRSNFVFRSRPCFSPQFLPAFSDIFSREVSAFTVPPELPAPFLFPIPFQREAFFCVSPPRSIFVVAFP